MTIRFFLLMVIGLFFLNEANGCFKINIFSSNTKIRALYKKMYEQKDVKKIKKYVKKVKKIHHKCEIDYQSFSMCNNPAEFLYGVSSLAIACEKDLEFAKYILDKEETLICQYALPFFCIRVARNSFCQNNQNFFKYLIEKKADINGRVEEKENLCYGPKRYCSPLGYYLRHSGFFFNTNASFIKELLHSGAVLRRENDEPSKGYNAISFALGGDCHMRGSTAPAILAAFLFNERLHQEKKTFLTLLLISNRMRKKYDTRIPIIIPKVILCYIGNILFWSSDAYKDIHRALTCRDYKIRGEYADSWVSAEEKINDEIKKKTWRAVNTQLPEILRGHFWRQPFKDVIEKLTSIVKKNPAKRIAK